MWSICDSEILKNLLRTLQYSHEDVRIYVANRALSQLADRRRQLAFGQELLQQLTPAVVLATDLVDDWLGMPNDVKRAKISQLARTLAAIRCSESTLRAVNVNLGEMQRLSLRLVEKADIHLPVAIARTEKAPQPQRTANASSASARRLISAAVCVLPASQRARYSEEFSSELHELVEIGANRQLQLGYSLRLLIRAWALRTEIRSMRRKMAAN